MLGLINRMTEGGIIGYPVIIADSDDEKANEKRWQEILETIADGFKAAKEINDYKYDSTEDEVWQRFRRGMDLYKEYFFALWD